MEEILIELAKRGIIAFGFHLLQKNVIKPFLKPKNRKNSIPDIHGVKLLQVMVKEKTLQVSEIRNIFGSELRYRLILNNKEKMTTIEIEKLSNFFKISPAAFFPKSAYS